MFVGVIVSEIRRVSKGAEQIDRNLREN